MKFRSSLLVLITGMVSFFACKKDESTTTVDLGYNYFPLNIGSEKIFQVDSIGWLGFTFNPQDSTVEIDTVSYQVKEIVESFFTDNSGRNTARIVRYRRADSSHPWEIYKISSANLTATTGETFEDNTRYIKLVFPVKENETWHGNAFNSKDSSVVWEYSYENVNEPSSINSLSFDSTLTVLQYEEDNCVNYRNYTEKYAAGVGLYSKEYRDYEVIFCSTRPKNGFIYKESLLSFTP